MRVKVYVSDYENFFVTFGDDGEPTAVELSRTVWVNGDKHTNLGSLMSERVRRAIQTARDDLGANIPLRK